MNDQRNNNDDDNDNNDNNDNNDEVFSLITTIHLQQRHSMKYKS